MADLAAQRAADQVLVSAVQCDPQIGEVAANLEMTLRLVQQEAEAGVALAVFPELTLTGYLLGSREEGAALALSVPGPATERLLAACDRLQMYAVVGLLESENDALYNTAVLAGPAGFLAKYRKAHLPRVGVDRYLDHGNIPFTVHQTQVGPIGMLICYDHRFPEAIRSLALDGMAILAHPTNTPTGMTGAPGSRPPLDPIDWRARAERIIILSADRCGVERDVEFIGGSFVAVQTGEIVGRAPAGEAASVRAVVSPGKTAWKGNRAPHLDLESDLHLDRRPELYGRLSR